MAQAAVNMFRGEIYGYPHYLHTRFLLPKQVKFLWQDVICPCWPWAVSNTPPNFSGALDMAPALSIMQTQWKNVCACPRAWVQKRIIWRQNGGTLTAILRDYKTQIVAMPISSVIFSTTNVLEQGFVVNI